MWSVSAATLHLSRTAVALVPPDGQGVGNLALSARLQRVLVPTDLSEPGNAAVPWAYRMTERGGEVVLAFVTHTHGERASRGEAELSARLRGLTPRTAEERAIVTRTEVVRSSDPAKAVLALAEQLGVDAIVIAAHMREGTDLILENSTHPVMVVPAPRG
jgi:nucleotide-binding universal stress UspA family protein